MTAAAWQLPSLAVRAGQERSQFGEHGEALYLTSSFVFENAAQAARRFSSSAASVRASLPWKRVRFVAKKRRRQCWSGRSICSCLAWGFPR